MTLENEQPEIPADGAREAEPSTDDATASATPTRDEDAGAIPQTGSPSLAGAGAARDLVEAIITAVVLTLLFKTFVAEMFVIPTGSMAATLRGRHVRPVCPDCRFSYEVNASDEDGDFDLNGDGELDEYELEAQSYRRVTRVRCPNCGAPQTLDPEGTPSQKSVNGDRIIVNKFAYDLWAPDRWDVIVFKYPGNPKQHFIKRLVGLPNEMIKIWRGNVYHSPRLFYLDLDQKPLLTDGELSDDLRQAFTDHGLSLHAEARVPFASEISPSTTELHRWAMPIYHGAADGSGYLVTQHEGRLHVFRDRFQILRKPSNKLLSMLQVVHDASHVNPRLRKAGWPLRWSGDHWDSDASGVEFSVEPNGDSEAWLRYRHLPHPDERQWVRIQKEEPLTADEMPSRGSLIMDGYPYNSMEQLPNHWVGDLAVEGAMRLTSDNHNGQQELILELVRAGVKYRCRFDFDALLASLEIVGDSEFIDEHGIALKQAPKARFALDRAKSIRFRMTNVDDELRVWLGGEQLKFDAPTSYRPTPEDAPFYVAPIGNEPEVLGDTSPAAVGVRGIAAKVTGLRVLRDIYYTAKDRDSLGERDFDRGSLHENDSPGRWLNPNMFASRRSIYFVLDEQQYFPLGDNSPQSSDARRWDSPPPRFDEGPKANHYVPRRLLIGEAAMIYWGRFQLIE